MLAPWKESYAQPRQHIKKQRHDFANKGPSSQSYGFSSGHVWVWELDYKERWAPKNWWFWTGEDSWESLGLQEDEHQRTDGFELEKTLESPLDCKKIQPVHPEGDQSWGYSLEGLMLKLKLQYFGHFMWRADSSEKTLVLRKIEGRRERGRPRMRWLDGITDSRTWVWANSWS